MSRGAIKAMLLEVIGEIDYDLSKFFDVKMGCSEDPEEAENQLSRLTDIVQKHLKKTKGKK